MFIHGSHFFDRIRVGQLDGQVDRHRFACAEQDFIQPQCGEDIRSYCADALLDDLRNVPINHSGNRNRAQKSGNEDQRGVVELELFRRLSGRRNHPRQGTRHKLSTDFTIAG
jgi:hypothetical protein